MEVEKYCLACKKLGHTCSECPNAARDKEIKTAEAGHPPLTVRELCERLATEDPDALIVVRDMDLDWATVMKTDIMPDKISLWVLNEQGMPEVELRKVIKIEV